MSQPTLESLAQQVAAGDRTASDVFLTRLQALFRSLDGGMLERVALPCACSQGSAPARPRHACKPTRSRWRWRNLSRPGRAWSPSRRSCSSGPVSKFNVEEVVAGLREVRANGGIGSEELLSVLDEEVERP